jgi:hypothetical protein
MKLQISLAVCLFLVTLPDIAFSQTQNLSVRVVVNSNQDGAIQADDVVTLREAIAIVNGNLSINRLSDREKTQVQSLDGKSTSRIEFNLPSEQNTIELTEILPPLVNPGLVIEGTSDFSRDLENLSPNLSPARREALNSPPSLVGKGAGGLGFHAKSQESTSTPTVTITPAYNSVIFRGLTVAASNITIRGLSLYGFTSRHGDTASLPPADIFIAPIDVKEPPPTNVIIENNWLGISPNIIIETRPPSNSAFGVSVFNAVNTIIQNNRIANHDGSAIITSVRAENLLVKNNIITGNGFAGMPDAIRLEGLISNAQISGNQIERNAGSAVYLFKPEGSVKIDSNKIKNNGQMLQRAAIYLMGNNHEVINNQINNQPGPGVVVAAYPPSQGNRIQNNQFADLKGLSIDLVTQYHVGVQDYQQGDGANPVNDTYQRHRKTGNFGINAPRFLSPEFFISPQDGTVVLDGFASPGSVVEIYRVSEDTENRVTLNKVIAKVNVNSDGRFSYKLGNLKAGDRFSAIATHPKYGTSEPAVNTVVRSIEKPVIR